MADFIRIPNFEKWQHYKDRTPPWIKLHASLLRDYDFSCLQDASKSHLMLIWLLASQLENKIPNNPEYIQRLIGAKAVPDISEFVRLGFIEIFKDEEQLDSKPLAECKQVDVVETETETERKNTKKKISRKQKTDLAKWETANGELTAEKLSEFGEKHSLSPPQLSEMISTFRAKCKASDYLYVNFANAFESWDWKETIEKYKQNTVLPWKDKPQNRMPSPAGG